MLEPWMLTRCFLLNSLINIPSMLCSYLLFLKLEMCVLNKNLGLSRVDPKETIYTGVCPSESDAEEATNQESYCFCDQSSDCAPGNDVTSCPFEFDGSCLLVLLFRLGKK